MKLSELKTQVDNVVESVREHEQNPRDILVTLQVNHSGTEYLCANDHLEVHWDDNGMASGCVIDAYTDDTEGSELLKPWKPIKTAPKDGTLIQLRLDTENFDAEHCVEDSKSPKTIGHNNFKNDGIDKWQFAGWSWSHDHFCQGQGTPILWREFPA